MNTVEISNYDITKFMHYLGENRKTQPENSDINKFNLYIDNNNDTILTPGNGEFHWTFKDEIFQIKYFEEGEPLEGPLGPTYFKRLYICHSNIKKLEEFVKESLTWSKQIDDKRIKIYYSKSRGYWDVYNMTYVQTIDNIFMDTESKNSIINRIDKFINSKERYINFGRSYKLNFLLTGVPGSGKTSLIKAICHKYKRKLYTLNFTKSLTDENLLELITEIKDDSVLVLEDIDAYFIERRSQDINVSFSCLINILDGTLANSNGIITFITANNPENLDPAMIRPGRIDYIVKFDYPKKTDIENAFNSMTDEPTIDKFNEFYKNIKNIRVSMSAIIDYLFRYPCEYLEHINELLDQVQILHEIINDKTEKLYN